MTQPEPLKFSCALNKGDQVTFARIAAGMCISIQEGDRTAEAVIPLAGLNNLGHYTRTLELMLELERDSDLASTPQEVHTLTLRMRKVGLELVRRALVMERAALSKFAAEPLATAARACFALDLHEAILEARRLLEPPDRELCPGCEEHRIWQNLPARLRIRMHPGPLPGKAVRCPACAREIKCDPFLPLVGPGPTLGEIEAYLEAVWPPRFRRPECTHPECGMQDRLCVECGMG